MSVTTSVFVAESHLLRSAAPCQSTHGFASASAFPKSAFGRSPGAAAGSNVSSTASLHFSNLIFHPAIAIVDAAITQHAVTHRKIKRLLRTPQFLCASQQSPHEVAVPQ